MASCEKCEKCNKCGCKCTCVKEESKANWDWSKFQELVKNYSTKHPSQTQAELDAQELPKRFSISIVDNGIDNEWEIEYRTNINAIEFSNILNDYFGIESDIYPKTDFGIVGFISLDEEDEDEEE